MCNKLCRGILAAALVWAFPGAAAAGELNLTIANGRVTLIAQDVTIRQILAEWARIGETRIENGDKMIGPPVTLELRDVPESEALETVLRSAAGYVVAPRAAGRAGASTYDRILILATSRAPAVSPPPPTFNAPRPTPQPAMPVVDDTDAEPQNVANPAGSPQFPGPPQPGMQPFPQGQTPPQAPMTAPRPGQLPQPNMVPGNPYQPQPVVRPPVMPNVPGAPPQPTKPGGGGD
jgi:hypothetical protein